MIRGMKVLLILSMPVVAAMTMAISCGHSIPAPTESPIPAFPGANDTPPPDPLASVGPIQTPPVLTAEQAQRIEEIVRADPRMVEISGGVSYTLEHLGPWFAGRATDTGEDIFIGGTAYVVLSQPIAHVEREWPFTSLRTYYTAWPAEERAKYRPYKEGTETYAVDNLVEMYVSVDLERGELVAIDAGSDVRYGQTVTRPEPTGPTPVYTMGAPQSARDVFTNDERLQEILAGRAHQTPATFSYTVGSLNIVAMSGAFEEVQEIEADWTMLFDFDQHTGQYETHTIHFKATEVQSVSVVIDLAKGEIAWLEPNRYFSD